MTLGCSRQMQVVVRTRGAVTQSQPLHDVSAATWERVLDGQSRATVVIPIRNQGCCASLARTRPWSHEIMLVRSGEVVWEGPIVGVSDDRFAQTITIRARDMSAWLGKRRIHTAYDYTGNPTDLTDIATRAISDALGPDEPGVLQWLTTYPSGVMAERRVGADVTKALDEVNDMARTGLNYTTVGRRLILFGETTPLANIGTLTDTHFARGIPLEWDGLVAASSVAVIGEGVVGRYSTDPGVYGLLEEAVKTDGVLDKQAAETSARLLVQASFPPPLLISAGEFGALSSRAPVLISQLVPGVSVTIVARGNCETVTQQMRLEKLSVVWSPEGETVSPSLAPIVRVG